MDTQPLDLALRATGELLARRGQHAAIVVVGGTALNLLKVVDRVTRDVDVIAAGILGREGAPTGIRAPDPLPVALSEAVATVARDLIHLKLYAAADDTGPGSRHVADLIALRPTADELEAARGWITETQDASPDVAATVKQVIGYVLAATR